MTNYYTEKLSAKRLEKCYDIAPPRIREYLEAELAFVTSKIKGDNDVLELGCGYGRFLKGLVGKAKNLFGVDLGLENLLYAKEYIGSAGICHFVAMDAANLGFPDNSFDCVLCIQNGISAFHIDRRKLVQETMRVCRPNGKAIFSSYSQRIWDARLKWFELQAKAGLLGEIDYSRTADGTIVCKDGFSANTVSPEQFSILTEGLNAHVNIEEINNSGVFCEIKLPG